MNSSKVFSFLHLGIMLLGSCDTTLNVKSPAKNYFIKYFGSEGSQTGSDFVVNNSDGTFVLFGTTQKPGKETKFYLIKADAQGNSIWERTFGTPGSTCQARDVELANDGRIVILGNMIHPGRADFDIFLKTFNPDGTSGDSALVMGYQNINSPFEELNEDASTVSQTNDGFIVAGSTGNIAHNGDPTVLRDALFLRVNDDLTIYIPKPPSVAWRVLPGYGQGTESVSTRIVQLPDRASTNPAADSLDFYVFGYSKSYNQVAQVDFNFWYFLLNRDGEPAGTPASAPLGSDGKDQKLFAVTSNMANLGDGFFLGGLETDPNNNRLYFTKLRYPLDFAATDFQINPAAYPVGLGKLNTVLNPPHTANEHVSACPSGSSGYYLLTNTVDADQGDNNLFLTKVTAAGDLEWSTPILYGGEGDDFAGSVTELPDGKVVILGTMTVGQASGINSETKMVLIKVNKDGQFSD